MGSFHDKLPAKQLNPIPNVATSSRLSNGVVDLVRTCVCQLLSLEPNPRWICQLLWGPPMITHSGTWMRSINMRI